MKVTKYLYSPTNQGNYYIIKIELEEKLNSTTNQLEYTVPKDLNIRWYIRRHINGGYPGRPLTQDLVFDTRADAINYANTQIIKYKAVLMNNIKSQIDRLQKRIDKFLNKQPKSRYLDLTND